MESAARERRGSAPVGPPRRRARIASALVALVLLVAAAWFALRRRRPAMPAWVEQGEPGPPRPAHPSPAVEPSPAPRPRPDAPSSPPVPDVTSPEPEPAPEPESESTPEPTPEPAPEPAPQPTTGAGALSPTRGERQPGPGVAELTKVSGLGRRSAEALVVAGITSLADLAASDDERLGAAMDDAGVRRSTTLSTWPGQARRLLGSDQG